MEIKYIGSPVKSFEENFELIVHVKKGKSLEKSNYGVSLSQLKLRLKYSQHCEASTIISFSISKVIRGDEGEIIESTILVSDGKPIFKCDRCDYECLVFDLLDSEACPKCKLI